MECKLGLLHMVLKLQYYLLLWGGFNVNGKILKQSFNLKWYQVETHKTIHMLKLLPSLYEKLEDLQYVMFDYNLTFAMDTKTWFKDNENSSEIRKGMLFIIVSNKGLIKSSKQYIRKSAIATPKTVKIWVIVVDSYCI